MIMPERSFGRTVRYRRTKLGLSQAKLGELVGRSTATVRSWERDQTRPNDPKVLSALAAILGISEGNLYEKAELELPMVEETSPTIEQALATLSPPSPQPEPRDVIERAEPSTDGHARAAPARHLVAAGPTAGFVAPPDPYVQTPLTPNVSEVSYMEDSSQRQLYRVRNLATAVVFVALIAAFIWAVGEGLGALGNWWDDFFGNLRL
jgi:transcriptional regulator with XRE-family HTH domain